jgi:hypothetical protein
MFVFVYKLSSQTTKIDSVQKGYTLYGRLTFTQVHTLLKGSKIHATPVILKYVQANLESSHALVCGEVQLQLDPFVLWLEITG